jgi:SAM-dependent methyltransferase
VDLKNRCRQHEIMDEPDVDAQQHWEALRALERMNQFCRRDFFLWPQLRRLAETNAGRPLRVLDIATGGGDLPIGLWHRAKQANIPMFFDGCDCSDQALVYARQQAEQNHAHVRFFHHDALEGPLPDGYDIVVCSLFLHHLDEDQAVRFLRWAKQAARRAVLVYDLHRIYLGYLLAFFGTRLLSPSPMTHLDGPMSVQAAYTIDEVQALARRAGLDGAVVRRVFPLRYLLSWRRPCPWQPPST